jgi:site-specific recombinase XerC
MAMMVDWLKNKRASGLLSVQSSNYYLGCIKSFLSWMVKDGRIDRNPLAHLTTMNAKVDVRRERRCLPPEEFGLFLEAAGQGPRVRKVFGKDRRMVYIPAASSGFRCSELASLTPESFDISSIPFLHGSTPRRSRREQASDEVR